MPEQVSQTRSETRYWFPKPYADFVQRLRVPAGFLLLVTFALLSRPTLHSMAVGIPVTLLGLSLRAWAAGHLEKNQTLATSGPYARLRNPLYVGTLVGAFGIVIASRSVTLAVVFAAVFLLVYLPAVELEEQHLRSIFPEYAAYAQRVPRFIPQFGKTSSHNRFSPAIYRKNQEWKASLGFVVALLWLVVKTVFL